MDTKKILLILIILFSSVSFFMTVVAFQSYNKEIVKVEKLKKQTLTLWLEEYFQVTPNDIILTQYATKTGLFSFDPKITPDWIYQKNWLPLNYNYCQTLKTSLQSNDNDFDRDTIPDTIDKFPYDYSNWDITTRESDIQDYDGDGIVNKLDKDAEWNGVADIMQTICTQELDNWFDKQIYSQKYKNVLENSKDAVKTIISEQISQDLTNYWLEIANEELDTLIDKAFNEILSKEEIFIQIQDKYFLVNRKSILNTLTPQTKENE